MKFLNEELKRRSEERRNDKGSWWTNWIVRIILLIIVLLIIRYFTDLQLTFFTDIFHSSRKTEAINNYENRHFE